MRIYFRNPVVLIFGALCVLFLVWTFRGLDSVSIHNFTHPGEQQPQQPEEKKPPKHKPEPTWTPAPIKDPFPLLEHSQPPPIPSYNIPRKDLHKEYDLPFAPPLFIGFGRTWPVLLQCVVSYITAGWPPEQIYVVENTGVQLSNAHGKLTLQNPFYLNYTILQDRLGVKIIRTPTLLNFAQMQNFFLNMALENNWEYYMFSHSDQLVFSLEEGMEGVTPPAGEEGYKPMYELVLQSIRDVRANEPRWGKILYAFNDYLTTFNTKVMDYLGGWDSMIPFYSTDCDMYSRMRMHNYLDIQRDAGHFNDISTVLNDLRVLYRDTSIVPEMVELNPLPPGEEAHGRDGEYDVVFPSKRDETPREESQKIDWNNPKEYYRGLKELGDKMVHFKLDDDRRGRNTWQMSQRGGKGEPYYYPAEGIAEAIHVLTVAGRQTYKRKWVLETCDLDGNGLRWEDAWHLEKGG